MAIINKNYNTIKLAGGNSYTTADLGNGVTASTVHQIFCVSAGTITITSLGGSGTFAWGATPGQTMDIILGSCVVDSGAEFIGFKSPWVGNATQQVFFG